MVCEKNADKAHDFTKDPIELVREGNLLRANGTTLGADNGIGVAAALAVAEDRSLEHGPLEMLFTIDEETGLTGAQRLEPGFVHSRILLNLDSEDEGEIYVGCAGGQDTKGAWKVVREAAKPNMVALELSVTGLRGGHSGMEIDKGRGQRAEDHQPRPAGAGRGGRCPSGVDQGREQAQRDPARGLRDRLRPEVAR